MSVTNCILPPCAIGNPEVLPPCSFGNWVYDSEHGLTIIVSSSEEADMIPEDFCIVVKKKDFKIVN